MNPEPQPTAAASGGWIPIRDFAEYFMRITPGAAAAYFKRRHLPMRKIAGRWFVPITPASREQIEENKAIRAEEEGRHGDASAD